MSDSHPGYDIIGDVHGCAEALTELLSRLGYRTQRGVFQHAKGRIALFVGDILDRGPAIREAVDIVRAMVERGVAAMVMGNHEYDALGYATELPGSEGAFLRAHNHRHHRAISNTLEQYANYPDDWRDLLKWLYELPLFLEFDRFRVVHACWDQELIDEFCQRRPDNTVDKEFLIESADPRSFAGRFMQCITRGSSVPLPEDRIMTSPEGFPRRRFRAKFWVEAPLTYSDVAFQPDPLPNDVSSMNLSNKHLSRLPFYSPEQKPLFFGHYWLRGIPQPLTENIACLDYSAVNHGRLVAYRMDESGPLQAEHFVWVET